MRLDELVEYLLEFVRSNLLLPLPRDLLVEANKAFVLDGFIESEQRVESQRLRFFIGWQLFASLLNGDAGLRRREVNHLPRSRFLNQLHRERNFPARARGNRPIQMGTIILRLATRPRSGSEISQTKSFDVLLEAGNALLRLQSR